MNWIAKYRLNPDWFFPTDESDLEKTNREEIFELIKNHDRLIDSKLENRDVKISHLVGEEYTDPLISLNPYLDALYGKIDMTMDMPNILIYYIDNQPEPLLDGSKTQGSIKSKPLSAQTQYFDNLKKMDEFIESTKKENELFVYLIEPGVMPGTSRFSLRYATYPKNGGRYAGRPRKREKLVS